MFSSEEYRLLIDLVTKEQLNMLGKDYKNHKSTKYVALENIKVKLQESKESRCKIGKLLNAL